MSKQIKINVQKQLRLFDDVFHQTIIALERLEHFLINDENASSLKITAINTERDLHDDESNKPTKKLLYSEVQLQCSALFYQTKFDDEKLFTKTITYFLQDLLMWYGGRSSSIPFDDVDKFFIPVLSALDRQVNDVLQIMQTVQKYVCDIENDISQFDESEKEKAVMNGFEAFIKAQDVLEKRKENYIKNQEEVDFTTHKRGSVTDGLQRLYKAFLYSYKEHTPILFLESIRKKYLSDIEFDTTKMFLEHIDSIMIAES